jgi:hypothetical protein
LVNTFPGVAQNPLKNCAVHEMCLPMGRKEENFKSKQCINSNSSKVFCVNSKPFCVDGEEFEIISKE